ncbi:MAG TPA: NADH-quinone oxidoreductase subunit NuoE [Cyclobacteriaceae bacterium]|jgi:NADH-quinone oxidoreductase subunit E|nr:NADH-quinone oxidoreductase subunit NuoE [Cyclobacteriaceae bacterium]
MLSKQEIKEIDEAISLVPYKKAASIEALKVVQHHRHWVSDESLKELANYLDMSAEELDSVATFYNLIFRQPVGRHVILVCDSVSCWVMGEERIKEKLSERLQIDYGQTTQDGRFTMLPNPCLGTCDCAPAIMVGNDLYRNISIDQLEGILSKYE